MEDDPAESVVKLNEDGIANKVLNIVIKQENDITQDDYEMQNSEMETVVKKDFSKRSRIGITDPFSKIPRLVPIRNSLFEEPAKRKNLPIAFNVANQNKAKNEQGMEEDGGMNYDSDYSNDSKFGGRWHNNNLDTSCPSITDSYASIDDEDETETFSSAWDNDMQKLVDWPEDRRRDILMEIYSSIDASFCTVKKKLSSMYDLSLSEVHRIRVIRRQIKNRIYAKTSRRRKLDRLKNLVKDLSQAKSQKQKLWYERQILLAKKSEIEGKCKQLQANILTEIRERYENIPFDMSEFDADDSEAINTQMKKLMEQRNALEDKKETLISKYNELCTYIFDIIGKRYGDYGPSEFINSSLEDFNEDGNSSQGWSEDAMSMQNYDDELSSCYEPNLQIVEEDEFLTNNEEDSGNEFIKTDFITNTKELESILKSVNKKKNPQKIDPNNLNSNYSSQILFIQNTAAANQLEVQNLIDKKERIKNFNNNNSKVIFVENNTDQIIEEAIEELPLDLQCSNSVKNSLEKNNNKNNCFVTSTPMKNFKSENNGKVLLQNFTNDEHKDVEEHFKRSLEKYTSDKAILKNLPILKNYESQERIMDVDNHFKRSLEKYNRDGRLTTTNCDVSVQVGCAQNVFLPNEKNYPQNLSLKNNIENNNNNNDYPKVEAQLIEPIDFSSNSSENFKSHEPVITGIKKFKKTLKRNFPDSSDTKMIKKNCNRDSITTTDNESSVSRDVMTDESQDYDAMESEDADILEFVGCDVILEDEKSENSDAELMSCDLILDDDKSEQECESDELVASDIVEDTSRDCGPNFVDSNVSQDGQPEFVSCDVIIDESISTETSAEAEEKCLKNIPTDNSCKNCSCKQPDENNDLSIDNNIDNERINVLQHFVRILRNAEGGTLKKNTNEKNLNQSIDSSSKTEWYEKLLKNERAFYVDKCSLENINKQIKTVLQQFDREIINNNCIKPILDSAVAENLNSTDNTTLSDAFDISSSCMKLSKNLTAENSVKKEKILMKNDAQDEQSSYESDDIGWDDDDTDSDSAFEESLSSSHILELKKIKLLKERDALLVDKKQIEDKYLQLYKHIFQPLGFQNGTALLRLYLSYCVQLLNIPGIDIFDSAASQLNNNNNKS